MAENLPDFTPSPNKKEAASCIKTSRAKRCELANSVVDKNVWGGAEFNKKYENGEFSKEEKAKRTVTLAAGVTIFRDIGLIFYKVQKGDNIDKIRDKLVKFKEFAYLDCLNLNSLLMSFNIRSLDLKTGMFIPLPLPPIQRRFEKKDFLANCKLAVDELRKDPIYGEFVNDILKKVSIDQVIGTMYAVAKSESGGVRLGQFAFHRYEPDHRQFSYSIFHVLMERAGLKARKNLNMTIGQCNHPKNAAKLFLAFLIEQFSRKKAEILSVFPLDKNVERFATYFNGNWRETNKGYPDKLRKYYAEAFAPEVRPEVKPEKKPEKEPELFALEDGLVKIGKASSMMEVLEKADNSKYLKNTGDRLDMGGAILSYLKSTYGRDIFYPSDYLAVKKDSRGVYAVFVRKNNRGIIRMSSPIVG